MPKKLTTKKRTQIKGLPKKDKDLSAGDMKKVKGGFDWGTYDVQRLKKPPTTK